MQTQLAPEPVSVRAQSGKRPQLWLWTALLSAYAARRSLGHTCLLGHAFSSRHGCLGRLCISSRGPLIWRGCRVRNFLPLSASWAGAVSLSNNTQVTLEVRNESRIYVACQVIDDVPRSRDPRAAAHCKSRPQRMRLQLRHLYCPAA